jgi:predicted RecB family nuclease
MATTITAAHLYSFVECPHRVTMDFFAEPAKRDPVDAFVQLLWDRGTLYEKEVIAGLKRPFADLSQLAEEEKERATIAAMDRGIALIYGGRISAADLLGYPDLLRREGGGYIAGDIKSGSGEEGEEEAEDPRPKKHYAVQLALYTDVLRRLGRSSGLRAFIWDFHGNEFGYDFATPHGKKNPKILWSEYEEVLSAVREIAGRSRETLPAYVASKCRSCIWHSECLKRLEAADDLTLIPEFGRVRRDMMIDRFPTIRKLAAVEAEAFIHGDETDFPGVSPPVLRKLIARAKLLSEKNAKPYLRAPITLPAGGRELFFDIEVDPIRDLCYLHGFIERDGRVGKTERYVSFFADEPTPAAEERAFADGWSFMTAQPAMVYFYSKYERTIYRKLRAKYPGICAEAELERLFAASAVDLHGDVVLKAIEWPTHDYSLKTLARYLGFEWRDDDPSGTASIEWFDNWVRTRDPSMKRRILDYNEDDCRATRVLLDGIRALLA